jgi:8-oxo-dGTP pyrophosphatase MutT (NUDIX family)
MNSDNVIPQAGAIPVRDGLVCLITSSDGQRWLVPKGMIDPGCSPVESAANEAWEEAGVQGNLHPEPVGSYQYEKDGQVCEVTLFVMQVTKVADRWPEKFLRQRRWLQLEIAHEEVQNAGLREVLMLLASEGPE